MEFVYPGKKSYASIMELAEYAAKDIQIGALEAPGALFLGDNFRIMSALMKNYEGKIDLVYIDPPFRTNMNFYYSDERCAHVSQARNSRLAYSDKFELDEYLEFIRERLYLIHRLLSERGSLYLHLDVNLGPYLKVILDNIFGERNFRNLISRVKSNPKNFSRKAYGNQADMILVYAKNGRKNIFNNVKEPYTTDEIKARFPRIDESGRNYTTVPCHAPGETINGATGASWKNLLPPAGRHWRCPPCELDRLDAAGLIEWSMRNVPRIKKFADDAAGKKIQDVWTNFKDPQYPVYPTEKNLDMLELIVRQSSNSDSMIMDCFCGSGAFLSAGLRHGRMVLGIDCSAVAIQSSQKRPELARLPVFSPAGALVCDF